MKHSLQSFAACTALALLPWTGAQAQQNNFTGASIAAGVGMTHNRVEYGAFLAGQTGKDNSTIAKLDGSYGFELAPQWVLTVGASYDLNKSDFGTVSYVDSGTTYTVSGKLKNHFSVYVAPGYRITPNWLAYAKLGLHYAKGEFNDTQLGTSTTSHNGVGFGLGVSTALSRQIDFRFEVQRINFDRQSANLSNGKPETTEAVAYIGYRF